MAISNSRLVRLKDERVTFTWKDYADNCRHKELTLEAVEFVRRFVLHIVPRGFMRIRYYGLLANRDLGVRLAKCRELLGVAKPPEAPSQAATTEPTATDDCIPACGQCGSTAWWLLWMWPRPSGPQLERHWYWDST